MRIRIIIVIIAIGSIMIGAIKNEEREISYILEVEGDVEEHTTYINTHFPQVEIVAAYHLLLQGLAIKGDIKAVANVAQSDFVKASYPVQTYTSLPVEEVELKQTGGEAEDNMPSIVNDTNFTGKGIKVGVVDTGIDYKHPDLRANFSGGYDVVDLDDDPMETVEGLPTMHGTHVAGIIAADGLVQGVAPDAELFSYRALGPGGMGTSIQVIAAMEEALRDGVDVINLSLGNTVNGPDYPTSKAVSKASKLGVAVVVANGNAGPEHWTVGAPATSQHAFSVGAYAPAKKIPSLYMSHFDKKIAMQPIDLFATWDVDRDYEVTVEKDVKGKFALLQVDPKTIVQDMITLQKEEAKGIILYEEKVQEQEWLAKLKEVDFKLPVAFVSLKDARWLQRNLKVERMYADIEWKDQKEMVAPFSSRGPVTVNWEVKPDLMAPGVEVLSTVPDGYDKLNGTSMAAPHVAGAIAVIKEAKPSWSNEQIFQALTTTAKPVVSEKDILVSPVEQGAGLIQVADAINTDVIIYGTPMAFGFVQGYLEQREQTLSIENVSKDDKEFRFTMPRAKRGLQWKLPQTTTVAAGEKVSIPIELKTNSMLLEDGIFADWFNVELGEKELSLPYIVINETANYPKVMGFTFDMNRFDTDVYEYELYAPEAVKSVKVKLYDPDSLMYKGELMEITDVDKGVNKGEIDKDAIDFHGEFYGLIVVELENGEMVHEDTTIYLE